MPLLQKILSDTLHLFYPHICNGCGSDLLPETNLLCLKCINDLPETNFAAIADNPVEKLFWGRINVETAHSEFYFAKESLIQHLIHQLKYKGNSQIGFYMGKLMGTSILNSTRYKNIDALIPLPLYPDKERKRGYNQAAVICEGMSSVMNVPVMKDIVVRQHYTDTQTKKHRTERWQNVEGSFLVRHPLLLQNKHVLLVDDVVTTGATLEACGMVIKNTGQVGLSIAALAHQPK